MGGPREGPDFQNLHRNKRSMTLNLKAPAGLAAFKRMVKKADVVVENFRPDVKKRLGIDYKTLAKINPRLVYASISGFGQDGPYADRPGFDQIAQGMGGLMSITGLPGQGPVRVGIPVADLSRRTVCCARHPGRACSSARNRRRASTSRLRCCKRRFSCSIFRPRAIWSAAKWRSRPATIIRPAFRPACSRPKTAISTSPPPGRKSGSGSARPPAATALLQNPDYQTGAARSKHRDALNAEIDTYLVGRTSAEWIERLNKAGVPCGPIYSIDQMFADPQVEHLGIAQSVTKKDKSKMRLVGQPVTLSRTPSRLVARPPELGEHTDAVLKEFGFQRARHRGAAQGQCGVNSEASCPAVTNERRSRDEMTQTDKMLSRKEGGVGIVTFNNPERHNAVSLEMWEATTRILERLRRRQRYPRRGAHRRRRQGLRVGRRHIEIRQRARHA